MQNRIPDAEKIINLKKSVKLAHKNPVRYFNNLQQKLRFIEKLQQVDPGRRSHFMQQFKAGRFEQIADYWDASILALSALETKQMSQDEVFTVFEIEQHVHSYGRKYVQFISILDGNRELTREAHDYLGALIENCYSKELIPSSYLTKNKKINIRSFLEGFVENLKQAPNRANLFYVIDQDHLAEDKQCDDEGAYSLSPFTSVRMGSCISTLSYTASEVIGRMFRDINWKKKEYRLGHLDLENIREAQRKNINLASMSTALLETSYQAADATVTQSGFSQYDEAHREQESVIPKGIRGAISRMMDLERDITKFPWSRQSFLLMDNMPPVGHIPISKINQSPLEELFCIILDYSCYRLAFPSKENKNNTSVMMWIMIMDMAEQMLFWCETFGIDVYEQNDQTFWYKDHMDLYLKLRGEDNFDQLDVKEKIFILEEKFRNNQTALDIKNRDLFFRKKIDDPCKNTIYLECRTDQEMKEQENTGTLPCVKFVKK